jgi:shikimate dehydrogenase
MTSKHFAVLGDPISHSLSPSIHLAAYKHLGLDWTYEKVQVPKGNLDGFLSGQGSRFSGLSVTMPLKLEAAALAEDLDEFVKLCGVANTLVNTNERWSAANTDVFGIIKALGGCWDNPVSEVAILGSGATAQSALIAISRVKPEAKITVYARGSSNTSAITALSKKLDLEVTNLDLLDFGTHQDLTISTLPPEGVPQTVESQRGWLLDVNYANPNTAFATSFDRLKVVSGKAMLLWQAVAQIRLFFSFDVSKELPDEAGVLAAMRAAL